MNNIVNLLMGGILPLNIRETDLPGIGRKYQIETRSEDKVVVIIHDDGKREIYHINQDDPTETICVLTIDDNEARQLAGIIGGMSYKPKALENIEHTLEDLVIDWYKLEAHSKSIGHTIGELTIRQNTGATIIAVIERNHQTKINPGPDYMFQPDSTLVVVGEREHIKKLKHILVHGI